jgi:hypothetical protein
MSDASGRSGKTPVVDVGTTIGVTDAVGLVGRGVGSVIGDVASVLNALVLVTTGCMKCTAIVASSLLSSSVMSS